MVTSLAVFALLFVLLGICLRTTGRGQLFARPRFRRSMVLLDYAVYQETKRFVLGTSQRSEMLEEFAAWFLQQYGVKVLNIEFGRLRTGPTERYRLYVIVDDQADYQKMFEQAYRPNPAYQRQIAGKFHDLALKYRYAKESQLADLFVIYNDFSQEARTEANQNAAKEVKRLIRRKYPMVWEVLILFAGAVFFYHSESDVAANKDKGISDSITQDYYDILKTYDELDYFTLPENVSVKFDSKENLDKNFAGSFYYYSK